MATDNDGATSQAALLRILGHEVEVAYDGEAALEKAREFRPEIVLLDLGMPGMDGFEVARQLRATSGAPGLRLIALTGYGQPNDRQRALDVGFDEHLVKPVDPARLLEVIA